MEATLRTPSPLPPIIPNIAFPLSTVYCFSMEKIDGKALGKRILMIMVDGFGIPEGGWSGSVYDRFCVPGFVELMEERSFTVDPRMGVPGLPQSATGQTALFTGENAAKLMKGHVQGFPGPTLRELIAEENIFSKLLARGAETAFANAYVRYTLEELAKLKSRSVTTVMTEASLGWVRGLDYLEAGKAVYHDITRKSLAAEFGIDTISPAEAAGHLVDIANENDFTLFEYFLTDHAGHKRDSAFLAEVLREFSEFFMELAVSAGDGLVVALTSDHGNCEDLGTKRHTANPVPLFLPESSGPLDSTPIPIQNVVEAILGAPAQLGLEKSCLTSFGE